MKQQRNTKQRKLILDSLRARSDHPSAEQIYQDIRAIEPKISRGTVYRNLNILIQNGEILPVKLPKAERFEAHRTDRHYHLVCTDCGKVSDVPQGYHRDFDREVADKTGYFITGHSSLFEGLCPDCQKKTQEA